MGGVGGTVEGFQKQWLLSGWKCSKTDCSSHFTTLQIHEMLLGCTLLKGKSYGMQTILIKVDSHTYMEQHPRLHFLNVGLSNVGVHTLCGRSAAFPCWHGYYSQAYTSFWLLQVNSALASLTSGHWLLQVHLHHQSYRFRDGRRLSGFQLVLVISALSLLSLISHVTFLPYSCPASSNMRPKSDWWIQTALLIPTAA